MASVMIDRAAGLSSSSAWKGPCRVATTANITLSGLQTIDGVTLVADDRVLVKNQTTSSQNGIYVADTGTWSRAKDFSRTTDVVTGTQIFVTSGTVSAKQVYQLTSVDPVVVGTDNITLSTPFSGLGVATAGVSYFVGLDSNSVLVKSAPGFVKVTDYGVASADFTEAYTAAAAPVFVPYGSYTIATDVTGEFFSFGHVPVDATGAVYVKDLLSAVTTPKQKAARNIEIIAHRGFKSQFPQNTLLAASAAALSGAHAIECDVSVSSDGTLYCFHDATVDALTDGTGTFTALTDAYIDALVFDEVVGTSYSSITMGKFADILQVCREFGLKIYPEVKAYRTQADIALMVTAVEDAGMDEMCVFQSSTFSDLTYIRSTIGSNVGVGFLGAGTTGYEPYIRDLAELGNGTLFWNYSDVISAPAIVDHCFNRGVDLCVFTLTTAEDARKVARLGINKMMSDVWLGI